VWMSIGYDLKIEAAIALHSMCHPGRPSPQGDGHLGSPSLLFFQSAKSYSLRFSLTSADVSTPSPSASSSFDVAEVGSSLA